jgi:hypothetical protein
MSEDTELPTDESEGSLGKLLLSSSLFRVESMFQSQENRSEEFFSRVF